MAADRFTATISSAQRPEFNQTAPESVCVAFTTFFSSRLRLRCLAKPFQGGFVLLPGVAEDIGADDGFGFFAGRLAVGHFLGEAFEAGEVGFDVRVFLGCVAKGLLGFVQSAGEESFEDASPLGDREDFVRVFVEDSPDAFEIA